jgi:hypothetical protein
LFSFKIALMERSVSNKDQMSFYGIGKKFIKSTNKRR